jgi:hypothetical protein
MLDQMLFNLTCGHNVVLGRLEKQGVWACEVCGKKTDLTVDPCKLLLEHDFDTATQIDLREKAKGKTVIRLD